MLEFQNIKIFFAKGYASNWLEEVCVVSKISNTVLWTLLFVTWMRKTLLEIIVKKKKKKENLENKKYLEKRW